MFNQRENHPGRNNPMMRLGKNFANLMILGSGFFYLLSLGQTMPIGERITMQNLSTAGLGAGIIFRFLLEWVDMFDNLQDLFRRGPAPQR